MKCYCFLQPIDKSWSIGIGKRLVIYLEKNLVGLLDPSIRIVGDSQSLENGIKIETVAEVSSGFAAL